MKIEAKIAPYTTKTILIWFDSCITAKWNPQKYASAKELISPHWTNTTKSIRKIKKVLEMLQPEAHHWQILCPPSCPITLLRTHTIQNNCMWCTATQKESPVFDMLSGQPKSDFLLTKLLETSQTDQKLMLICATCNCHCRPWVSSELQPSMPLVKLTSLKPDLVV